jgi:hypothetical protein
MFLNNNITTTTHTPNTCDPREILRREEDALVDEHDDVRDLFVASVGVEGIDVPPLEVRSQSFLFFSEQMTSSFNAINTIFNEP